MGPQTAIPLAIIIIGLPTIMAALSFLEAPSAMGGKRTFVTFAHPEDEHPFSCRQH